MTVSGMRGMKELPGEREAVNRCCKLILSWINPIATGAYQVNQFVNRAFCGDIAFDDVFALVERDFARSTAYITVIGVGHFTGDR